MTDRPSFVGEGPPGDEVHQSVTPPSTTTAAVDAVEALDHLPHDRRRRRRSVTALFDHRDDHVLRVVRGHHGREPRRVLERRSLRGAGLAGDRNLRQREPGEGRGGRSSGLRHRRQGVADVVELRLRVRERPLVAVPGDRPRQLAVRGPRCDRPTWGRQILPPFAIAEYATASCIGVTSRTPGRSPSGCRRPGASSARPGAGPPGDPPRTASSSRDRGSDRSSRAAGRASWPLPNPNWRRLSCSSVASLPSRSTL